MVRLVALTAFSLAACASNTPGFVWVHNLPPQDETPRIRVGDTLSVLVRGQESLSGDFVVLEDGTYLQPVVGSIAVVGKTAKQVERELVAALADGIVLRPEATVAIGASQTLEINVLGEVNNPGMVEVDAEANLLAVLARAGGLTEFARRNNIFLVRTRPRTLRVRFRYADLTAGDPKSLGFVLMDGDSVVVE